MDRNKKPAPKFHESQGREEGSCTSLLDPCLCVAVVATTREGTAAALKAAIGLTAELNPMISVLALKTASSDFPADYTSASLECIELQRQLPVSGLDTDENTANNGCHGINHECRVPRVMRRAALFVVGGKRRWWSSGEEKIEHALLRLGHHVIFIDIGRGTE